MLRVASHASGREVIDTGGDLLIGTSLQESLLKFKEHHRSCAIRRQVGAAFEARLETQRTDLLTRKYMDTVGQEQGATACVGLNHPSSHHYPSDPGTNRQDGKDGTNTSNSSRTNTNSTHISNSSNNNSTHTNVNKPHHPVSTTPLAEPDKKPDVSSFTLKTTNAVTDNIVVKNEPLDNTSYISGSKQPHPLSNCVTSSSESENAFRSNAAGTGAKVKGRMRKSSRDLVKTLTLNHTSLYNNDDASDLTLTADDILNGKIGSSPLLKPLEEGEEMVQDTTAITSNSTRTVTMATAAPTASTPATVNGVGGASTGRCDQSLIKQLDAFSKVMNQVEQQEKAKERRASFSSNHTSYSMVNPHLVSPPPYSMTSVPTPTAVATVASSLNHYGNSVHQYNASGLGYTESPAPYPTYTNNSETLHSRQRSQLHLPLSNTPTQMGQPLLSSPVCTQSPGSVPQRSLDSYPIAYHHGNQPYTTPYSHAGSSHWNTSQQGVGSAPPTGMGSVTPTGMGPVTPTGMGPITPTGMGPSTPNGLRTSLIGQKRHSTLPQYAPPIKVPHLSSHPSNGLHPSGPHPQVSQVFMPSTSNTQPPIHQSFLPAYHS